MSKVYNQRVDIIMDNVAPGYGYGEEDVASAEAALGMSFPKFLRDYYIRHGAHPINTACNELQPPHGVYRLYAALEEQYEDDPEDFVDTFEVDLEEAKNMTEDYLFFYYENQGVWNAGTPVKDEAEDPQVYYDIEGMLDSSFMSNSVSSFLLSMLWENIHINDIADEHYADDTALIEAKVREHGLDIAQLKETKLNNKYCRSCFDNDEQKLYLALVNKDYDLVEFLVVNYKKLSEFE